MREVGTLLRIEKDMAVVRMEPRGGCRSCAINTYCRQTGTGIRELRLPLPKIRIKPGDLVAIDTPARSLVTAAFLVFILPLILSITAYGLIKSWARDDGLAMAGFFIVFILAELLVAFIDRRFGRGRFFQPQILGKVTNGKSAHPHEQ